MDTKNVYKNKLDKLKKKKGVVKGKSQVYANW